MLNTYLKIALRYLHKNKTHAFINIGGLSVGMAVAMLIGLWVWNELSFNKYHQNYNRIAEVMQQKTLDGKVSTGEVIPMPLNAAMHESYGSDFKYIVMSTLTWDHILSAGDNKITYTGKYISADAPEMFSLRMLKGTRNALKGPSSMLLSQTVAKALFGDADPMGKVVKLDDKVTFLVGGVYEDLPRNSTLRNVTFMAPWDYFATSEDWIVNRAAADWNDDFLQMYVQIADHADMAKVSAKIRNIKAEKAGPANALAKPELFLQPMSKWHLYMEFKNGVNVGGAIQYVWLFGIIGIAVLLLACINFMNLQTARSEKRAKEVGIRKAIGSFRAQLIYQFYCESMLTAILAFVLALLLVVLVLPFFNNIADKDIQILWSNPLFWSSCIGFALLTGLLAGSYPALYLSSFQPVKVLKGTFRAGRLAAIPRKVLVVVQFAVSVILIIGTIMVFKQIRFAQNRPVGYSREGLITIETATNDLHNHFEAVRADLLRSGAITAVSESSSPSTGVNNYRGGLEWKGKDPAMTDNFANIRVTSEYGKTIGWQFAAGRDFSRQLLTDSTSLIVNEAAVKYMGLNDPIGEIVRFRNKDYHIIGVIKDMVMQSPYEPVKQTIFYIAPEDFGYVNFRISPNVSAHTALDKIAAVCKTYSPAMPFTYKFADEQYARKFNAEERIGKLASCFTILAIFISCLGLFGMAAFMAEQRFKEIGVRKVMGASVFNLWSLLSKDFVVLVIIAFCIAVPVAYYGMSAWLQHYQYRATMSWWIFAVTGLGAIAITLLTVSYQGIKAALMNPVKSLRLE
ncbi:ABC transporter permease [Chitinophaga sp. GbtcB8]|uniref:ABC transporter permease n=1 Tax=Chitinophaga sp. GbtcB8 TaxID=2824753 RepID=UPI001C307693|nr:ABC transporter permease [Chitinophaga sp. GbtcB8]